MPIKVPENAGAVKQPLRREICDPRVASLVRSLLLPIFVLLMVLGACGCGGGGGDGGDADPLAPEINARVDGFVSAVNAENIDEVMSYLDTNIQSFQTDVAGFLDHEDLKQRFQKFFASASNIIVSIENREVVSDGESYALFAGSLSCSWTDAGGAFQTLPVETVEMSWQRLPNWAIQRLSGHAGQKIRFPPVF